MPKISVVIPTYNRAKFITTAINSVLDQTYRDFEIIVVDDGSTDQTQEKLESYGGRITNHSYTPNRGVSYARNRGIELARGEYIAFLDSDDYWKPEKLQKQFEFFQLHPDYSVVATQSLIHLIDDNLNTLKYKEKKEIHYELTYARIFQRPFIMLPSIMVKSHCFQEIG